MAYTRVNWEDLPSTNTPRNATNLNKMDAGIKDNDDRIKENEDKLSGTKPMGSIVVDDINGKNMFNINNILSAYIDSGGSKIAEASYARTIFVPCEANTQYTISKIASARFTVGYTTELPANNVSVSGITTDNTATSITITTGANAKYLVAFVYHSSYDNNLNNILNSIQVELGGSATTYTSPINIIKEENGYVKEDTIFYANDFKCRNMLGFSNIRNGIYKIGDGTYDGSGTTACCTTSKIEIDNTKNYVLSTANTQTTSYMYVMYYNASGTYLGYINTPFSSGSLSLNSYSNYSNAKYVNFRFDVAIANLINPQLEIGDEKTPYTPYKNFENEEIYSTNEMVIGKWIDGKDLYRTVVEITPTTLNTWEYVTFTSTVSALVNIYGYIIPTDYTSNRIPILNKTSEHIVQTNGRLAVRTGTNVYLSKWVVILEYTK